VDAEEYLFVGRIVEEHGDYGVGVKFGFGRGCSGDGAFVEERLGTALGAVPHGQIVSSSEQAQRHGCAHVAEAEKANLHEHSSLVGGAEKWKAPDLIEEAWGW
jgi:hypothetical protein